MPIRSSYWQDHALCENKHPTSSKINLFPFHNIKPTSLSKKKKKPVEPPNSSLCTPHPTISCSHLLKESEERIYKNKSKSMQQHFIAAILAPNQFAQSLKANTLLSSRIVDLKCLHFKRPQQKYFEKHIWWNILGNIYPNVYKKKSIVSLSTET